MRGERRLLRLGEYLVGRACQRLSPDVREERYREWAAELPAILHDPQVRPAPRRAVRMLGFAADIVRGTAMTPRSAQGRIPRPSAAAELLLLVAGLAVVALSAWSIGQAPGDGGNYLRLAWGLLFVAYLIRKRVRPGGRMTALLDVGATVTLVAWNVEQGDWVGYLLAASLGLVLLIYLLAWWLRLAMPARGRHSAGGSGHRPG